jgi:hypothetical protein
VVEMELSSISTMLAVAVAVAVAVPDDVCTVFELLMMCGETPETCRALRAIKIIVLRCILLVIISIY